MRLSCRAVFVFVAGGLAVSPTLLPAQIPTTVPDTQPATTAPATTTAPARRTLVVPPGFQKVENGGRVVLCQVADVSWVRDALSSYSPATRPSTMPADLLIRVVAQRPAVVDMMQRDLGLVDRVALDRLFDDTMLPELRRVDSFRAPVFYMVTTKPILKDLIKSGKWSDPRFYFNRLADEVMFPQAIPLSMGRPMDDTIIPVLHEETWDAARRKDHLTKTLQEVNRELLQAISGRAQFDCHMALIDFMMKNVFDPMKLKQGQQWLGLGAAGVLSCDYAHLLTGADRRELLAMLLVEVRRHPVPTSSIDLLNPVEASSIRRELVSAYGDAFRRKSVYVARKWIDKSGRESFVRVLESMRKNPPADGAALIALIKADGGIDLTSDARKR